MKTRWYVIQTQSNYEKRVQAQIREKTILHGLEKFVDEVLIPTEEVVEVRKGEKKSSERKFFPGYVLVKVNLTDEVWHMIKSTNNVLGFVGAERGSKPLPISQKEADRILKQMEDGVEAPRTVVNFEVGEEIRVIDGPFSSFQGVIEGIEEERAKLKVSVSIFGRSTPIELDYGQVEKI
ncbi:MAG: transcription termination/antitermination protein NusG [Pseudomonadota bacterium]|nr:transcription termination/antitermination protein NusG [Pseudomonadota bacterium]